MDGGELSNSPTGCFNPRRNSLFYPPSRILGGSQSPNVSVGEVKEFLAPTGNRRAIPQLYSPYPGHYTNWGILIPYLLHCLRAAKALARPGRKSYSDRTLTFASHSKTIQNFVRPTRSPRQQWPPRRKKNGNLSIVFFSRVGLRTYQHPPYEGEFRILGTSGIFTRNFVV